MLDHLVRTEPVLLPINVNGSQRRAIGTGERKSGRPTEDTGRGAESSDLACVYVQSEMLKVIGREGTAGDQAEAESRGGRAVGIFDKTAIGQKYAGAG